MENEMADMTMTSSPRPKRRPKKVEDAAFEAEMAATVARGNRNAQPPKLVRKAKGGKISEYGGKEMYASKSAMRKHEAKESPTMERSERKMAKGGMCRGMGAAKRGGTFSKNG